MANLSKLKAHGLPKEEGIFSEVTRMRVLYCKIELTGRRQVASLLSGKIEGSAEALQIKSSEQFKLISGGSSICKASLGL